MPTMFGANLENVDSMKTGVVIPCYNEEHRLDVGAFASFLAASVGIDLVFVDDGSTDGTAKRIETIIASAPGRAEYLRLAANGGKAEAVRRGMNHLMARGADVVGFWDADLATPLGVLPIFIALLARRPDIHWVFGARVQLLGRQIERRRLRHYLGRVFATFTAATLSLKVYDTQCGAKLFRASPALREVLAEPFLSRWIFEVEMIARLASIRGPNAVPVSTSIYELPLLTWRDVKGSKVKATDFLRAASELVKIKLRYGATHRIVSASAKQVAVPLDSVV